VTEIGGNDVSQRHQLLGAQQTHSVVATVCDDNTAQWIDAHVDRIMELAEFVACAGTSCAYDGTIGIKPADPMIACTTPALYTAIKLCIYSPLFTNVVLATHNSLFETIVRRYRLKQTTPSINDG
jgi:hypothetical protein